jgi:Ca2+-binding EF-hand superfamily protein
VKLDRKGVFAIAIATALATTASVAEKDYMHAAVKAEMRALDANHDGKISIAEYVDVAQQMFQSMDGNQDNRVTASEMDEAQQPLIAVDASQGKDDRARPRELSSVEKVTVIDSDGDGVLTAREHAAGATRTFASMDTNRDGYLTVDEISVAHQRMMMAARR